MRRFAVSSWSLDETLRSGFPLLDLPAALAAHGIHTLELCHFHLPRTDPDYLASLKAALAAAGVELYSLLIDTGDIASPDPAREAADVQLIASWLPIAANLGASRVRISSGQQPPSAAVIAQSSRHLREFAALARQQQLQVITENWQATSLPPEALTAILDGCEGAVGLCADTGNAEMTTDKYATLAQILPRASSIHFKARYDADGAVNAEDLQRCIALIEQAQFAGVITLIYGNKHHEWEKIAQLGSALQPLLAA